LLCEPIQTRGILANVWNPLMHARAAQTACTECNSHRRVETTSITIIVAEAGTSVACSTVAGASLPVIEPGHVHLRDTTAHVEGHKERNAWDAARCGNSNHDRLRPNKIIHAMRF
jgi:hypothetical protein